MQIEVSNTQAYINLGDYLFLIDVISTWIHVYQDSYRSVLRLIGN